MGASLIKNYTTQTNSHKGYTIEELKRLFGNGKQITSENLMKLIAECFNYELVSGEGIRILELKNNDFRNNTTKTFKLDIDVSKLQGLRVDGNNGIDVSEKDGRINIEAKLYDTDIKSNLADSGVYAVSLSDDGKLVVDTSQSKLEIVATTPNSVKRFEKKILQNNFNFKINITGRKIKVTKITTYIKIGDTIIDKREYDTQEDINRILNSETGISINCGCFVKRNEESDFVTKEGWMEVEYTNGSVPFTAKSCATTTFVHPVYYGFTSRYTHKNFNEIHPLLQQSANISTSLPGFKVYSSDTTKYDNNSNRTGLLLNNINGGQLSIVNTDDNTQYILGIDSNIYSEELNNTSTPLEITNDERFTLNFGYVSPGKYVYEVIAIPYYMGELDNIIAKVGNRGGSYDNIDSFIEEDAIIEDHVYTNDNTQKIDVRYRIYTLKHHISGFTEENPLSIKCVLKNKSQE